MKEYTRFKKQFLFFCCLILHTLRFPYFINLKRNLFSRDSEPNAVWNVEYLTLMLLLFAQHKMILSLLHVLPNSILDTFYIHYDNAFIVKQLFFR